MSIIVENLRRTFGSFQALRGLNLEIGDHQLVALLGPSGSGKTTLLRILGGLDFPDPGAGKIIIHGEDVTEQPAAQRKTGFVFQHYALFNHLTVFENVAFGLEVRPKKTRPSKTEIRDKALELLQLVQLQGLEQRLPSELSGGQRQRVALARALAIDPKVLLLDEPFGALDAKVRKDLRRWLRAFHQEIGVTTVFVTHDQQEALELADVVVVMNQGQIEQVGTPQEIFDKPATAFVYEFLGDVNKVHKPGKPGVFYVRPHEVEVLFAADCSSEFHARVEHLFAAGPSARLTLRLETKDTIDVDITRQQLEEMGLSPGDEVGLKFKLSTLPTNA
ncbi:MAG: TOBE-like domain-containing protein [Verrucomicrobiota bacterium]